MHLKITFIATSKLVFDQTTGHDTLTKLIHKINDYRHQESIMVYGPKRDPG